MDFQGVKTPYWENQTYLAVEFNAGNEIMKNFNVTLYFDQNTSDLVYAYIKNKDLII